MRITIDQYKYPDEHDLAKRIAQEIREIVGNEVDIFVIPSDDGVE